MNPTLGIIIIGSFIGTILIGVALVIYGTVKGLSEPRRIDYFTRYLRQFKEPDNRNQIGPPWDRLTEEELLDAAALLMDDELYE